MVQSPLNRLASGLARQSPRWWPLYTCIAAVGYWASSRGSRAWRTHHERPGSGLARERSERAAALRFGIGSLALLGIYPLFYAGRGLIGDGRGLLLFGAALVCFSFNFLRGFVEPYSATALILFTQEKGLAVPVSLISGFNSFKRSVHFAPSALFFIAQQRAVRLHQESDAVLSNTLMWLCAAFALLLLPAAWSLLRQPYSTDS